jgi:predicted DNA-binding protein (MmcQ/YjbR family)
MNKKQLEKYLSEFNGSEGSYPFGADALVFKVMNKMFALVSQREETPRVTLKCNPVDAEVLVSQYKSVVPGYYMNKKHWITISLNGDLPESVLVDLAKSSYELIVSKLTKADKSKLEHV